jgi:hypothetical protein
VDLVELPLLTLKQIQGSKVIVEVAVGVLKLRGLSTTFFQLVLALVTEESLHVDRMSYWVIIILLVVFLFLLA